NHQSALDLIVFGEIFPTKSVVIGKKQLAYIPIFGWLFALAGNLLIDRGHHKKAMSTMQVAHNALLKGDSLFIFPEGTRTVGATLKKFKSGAFYTALQAGVPLVPLVASTYEGNLYKGWGAGTALVKIMPPIP